MTAASVLTVVVLLAVVCTGQRITTIQLDGVQYFISRMNPYSPELNYFLAYQYCRSIGLQLASFESKEKADSMTQYLLNAGYNGHDYWTSGNQLGADMLIWMSSGVTFNATFDYMRKNEVDSILQYTNNPVEDSTETTSAKPVAEVSARVGRRRKSRDGGMKSGCVALKAPTLDWDTDNCEEEKDFICEQTRCYYYNYGSIPVSTSQGNNNHHHSNNNNHYNSKPISSSSSNNYNVNNASSSSTTTSSNNNNNKYPYNNNVGNENTKQTQAPATTTTTTTTTTTISPTTPPLGPLLNFKVNRRITLRPVIPRVLEKEADENVVYVTAVGASNAQYVTTQDETTTTKVVNEEEPTTIAQK